MAGFLKRDSGTVNRAGGVNPASSPNVGQYGWTSYDSGKVNQLVQYVEMGKGFLDTMEEKILYVEKLIKDLESSGGPEGLVLSVNGQKGIVNLRALDIPEESDGTVQQAINNIRGVTGTVISSPTAPSDPFPNQRWFNTSDGAMYLYYRDADSSQWIEENPASSSEDALRFELIAPNGGSLIGHGETTVDAKLHQFKTAADFGIKGDGSDETINLRRAFASGHTVWFPKGTYGQTQHVGIASNTTILAEAGAVLKMLDGVDQVYHSIVSINAMSLDARLATDANVDTVIGSYVTNVLIKGLTVDANYRNRMKSYNDREQGTGIELHAVLDSSIEGVHVIDGVQHCINVRAGTGSYNKGYDYVEKMPSRNVRIIDCITENQLLDDGITTHDSEYIWIERCEARCPRNATDPSTAVSNGIEVDDGSRYVWVTDCLSIGGFGAYQAKGHTNTPPAHHVWFTRCHAENTHLSWVISAVDSPSTDFESDAKTCHHIYITDCSTKNTYVFSNVTAWNAEAHFIQLLNVRNIFIKNFTVDNTPVTMPNDAGSGKAIFRFRGRNSYVYIDGLDVVGADNKVKAGDALITVESNAQDLHFKDVTVDKFTAGQVLFTNAGGVNWTFEDIKLKVGSPTYPVIKLGAVGGGTLRAEDVKGTLFKSGYMLGSTEVKAHTNVHYERRVVATESAYHKVLGHVSAADAPSTVNLELGTSYTYNCEGTEKLVGRVSTQIMSGDFRDTTCTSRLRLSVRNGTSASTVTVLNLHHDSLAPAEDNKVAGGSSGRRFTQFYAASGTINTSDAREKTEALVISDEILDAWESVSLISFQWLSALKEKGDSARWHFGVMAQAVRDAFLEKGLNGCDYGLLCYDEWEADEEGEAGNRWGIRPDQCLFLEAALQRRNYKRLLDRVVALESK